MEAFDFDVLRERVSVSFVGRASVPTEHQSGDPERILRVLSGSLSATAEEIGDTIEVEAGQCLLSFDRAQRGIPEDHPFAFLGAGTCPR